LSQILQNQSLEMKNVLSLRGKYTHIEFNKELNKIDELLKRKNIEKAGPKVTAIHSFEMCDELQFMDIEVLIPLEKYEKFDRPYSIKPLFRLTNALRIEHVGDSSFTQNTAEKLNEFIKNENLTPITTAYNVIMNEPKTYQDADTLVAYIYVGLSPNSL